uniref:EGF-like domain-containing protein n=1 Tax=Trichuris muris TaxID=70415 RepID=A0A5S6QCG0_TRIMR
MANNGCFGSVILWLLIVVIFSGSPAVGGEIKSKCDPLSAAILLHCLSPLVQHNGKMPFRGAGMQSVQDEDACLAYAQYKRCSSEEMRQHCYNMVSIVESVYGFVCPSDAQENVTSSLQCLRRIERQEDVSKCLTQFGDKLRQISNRKTGSLQEHNDLQCLAVQEFSLCAQDYYVVTCGLQSWLSQLELIKRAAGLTSDNCEGTQVAALSVRRKDDKIIPQCDHVGHCTCPDGYSFLPSHECADVDECLSDVQPCSQRCLNTAGSYTCLCDERYFIPSQDDPHSCVHKNPNVWLFFAHGQSLWNISLDGKNFQLLRGGMQKAAMLDVDFQERMLYYVDVGADKLERIKFHGAFPQTIQDSGVAGTEGIGVDWVGRKLYMAKGSDLIVQQLDGRHRLTLYRNVFKLPRALAVHPQSAHVFNSDWGVQAFISKAAMDGSSFRRIVTGGLAWPNGLTIDHYADRLYWADAFLDTIESSDLEGRSRRVVLKDANSIPHVFGLAVTGEHLYWTDWTFRGIMRCNKLNGRNVTLVAQTALLPYDLKLCHEAAQPAADAAAAARCALNNGRCEQLCLLAPNGESQCACADGFRLATDQRSCVANCTAEQIACLGDNAKCISRIYWCDGTSHCANLEDERDCPRRVCSVGQFQCHSGDGCLAAHQICDGMDHCADRSDEKYCGPRF